MLGMTRLCLTHSDGGAADGLRGAVCDDQLPGAHDFLADGARCASLAYNTCGVLLLLNENLRFPADVSGAACASSG